MANKKCLIITASWMLILSSFYFYSNFGLLAAFVPLAISASLRNDLSQVIVDSIAANKLYQYGSLIYYGALLVVVLTKNVNVADLDTMLFVFVLGMPILLIALFSDIYCCLGKGKSDRRAQ